MGWLRSLFSFRPSPALEPYDTGAEGDLVLAQLRALGADLSKPRDVRHYLYFPEDARAQAAADELHELGYEVIVELTPGGAETAQNPWCVIASAKRVADEQTVPAETSRMSDVASRLAGEYDGWEAAL